MDVDKECLTDRNSREGSGRLRTNFHECVCKQQFFFCVDQICNIMCCSLVSMYQPSSQSITGRTTTDYPQTNLKAWPDNTDWKDKNIIG